MARVLDDGPYAPWNVKIITSSENHSEYYDNSGKRKYEYPLITRHPFGGLRFHPITYRG